MSVRVFMYEMMKIWDWLCCAGDWDGIGMGRTVNEAFIVFHVIYAECVLELSSQNEICCYLIDAKN